jgi:hypothetical protein
MFNDHIRSFINVSNTHQIASLLSDEQAILTTGL